MTLEFVKIVPVGQHFGLEASPEFPMDNREADSIAELVGNLVLSIPEMPDDMTIDVELDDRHFTFSKETVAPEPVVA